MYKSLGRLENQEHFKAIGGFKLKLKSLCNLSRGRRGCYRAVWPFLEGTVFRLSFLNARISCLNFAVRAAFTKITSLQLFASKLSCY